MDGKPKKHKSRIQKTKEYKEKYENIPKDFNERLNYMIDKYNLSEQKMDEIIRKKQFIIDNLYYKELLVILYEEPEGTPRPRFRIVNRKNIFNQAIKNSSFVHVYSLNAHEDSVYMKRLAESELLALDSLLCTPCLADYDIFVKTPSAFNIDDTFLSEIGLIRPITKPDWDNIGKKYSDMYNSNVWVDDTLVIRGVVNKFYSILPRVEIKLKYLNALYNKYQYNSMRKKIPNQDIQYIDYRRKLK